MIFFADYASTSELLLALAAQIIRAKEYASTPIPNHNSFYNM